MRKYLQASENILFFQVLLLFILIPLYPKFPMFNVKGTFVAVRLEDFVIAFTIILWGVYLIASNKIFAFFKDRLNQTLLLFFFIGAVSIFSGIFLTHTVMPNLGILHYLRRIELLLLLPIVYGMLRTRRQVIICVSVLSAVLLIVNVYAIGQRYLDWPVISTTNSEFSKGQILYLTPGARVNSTFAGHYDLAVFLSMALVAASPLFFYFSKLWQRAWILFLSIFSFVVLVMTAARLSFVATVAGVVFALFLLKKRLLIACALLVALVAVAYPSQLRERLVSTVTINILRQGERYQGRNAEQVQSSRLNIPTLPILIPSPAPEYSQATVSSIIASDITPGEPIDTTQLGVYRSFEIRLNLEWPRATRAFLKNPFLGTGYSSVGIATDNDFLRSLGEVGALGTLAFVLIFIETGKRLWVRLKRQERLSKFLAAGALAMILSFFVNAVFIDVFEASKVATLFWMFLGLSLAASKESLRE